MPAAKKSKRKPKKPAKSTKYVLTVATEDLSDLLQMEERQRNDSIRELYLLWQVPSTFQQFYAALGELISSYNMRCVLAVRKGEEVCKDPISAEIILEAGDAHEELPAAESYDLDGPTLQQMLMAEDADRVSMLETIYLERKLTCQAKYFVKQAYSQLNRYAQLHRPRGWDRPPISLLADIAWQPKHVWEATTKAAWEAAGAPKPYSKFRRERYEQLEALRPYAAFEKDFYRYK